MPVGDDTHAYRGRLPHLSKPDRTYYVTFCTRNRVLLPDRARDVVLESCIHDHEKLCWLDCAIVMPEHVHVIVTPYETTNLAHVLGRMKSASAYFANRLMNRTGTLWLRESFDRMVRSEENLAKKREYIFNNPVRAGLVARWEDYRWIWYPEKVGRRPLSPPDDETAG